MRTLAVSLNIPEIAKYSLALFAAFIPLISVADCQSSNDRTSPVYMSVEELLHACKAPAPCGKELECEGKLVRVTGDIDLINVFDKKKYPNLPYEKFMISDEKGKQAVEVWAVSDDNSEIFEKISQNAILPRCTAFIQGMVVGFDMPVMGACHRMIRIDLLKGADISFGP